MNYFGKYAKAGTANASHCLPRDCQCFALSSQSIGLTQCLDCQCFALSSLELILTQIRDCQCFALSSSAVALPKAFQTNALRLFGFFAPRLFTKASFRHILETKKPLICMRGFVAGTGIEPVFAP